MPRRVPPGIKFWFVYLLIAVPALFPAWCEAEWIDTTRSGAEGLRMVATESCKDDGGCLEVYAYEGEIWARLSMADDWGRGVDPVTPPTATVDEKDPLEPELYIVDGRVLRFQIWDGRGEMSKQMRRWIMGRKVLIRFACTTGEAWESEFSLRGSSPAIKRVVQAIYQKQSGKDD